MKTLVGLAAVAALVFGAVRVFGSPPKERRVCERINDLCDAGFTKDDLAECSSDLTVKLPKLVGESASTGLASCAVDSKSCAELIGCFGGVADSAGEYIMDGLERGYDRGRKHH